MAHDPSMGFADYFSAADAAASSVGTLMPEMDEGAPELYGLQAGMELLGMRGLAATSAAAASHGLPKAVLMDEEGADGSTMRFFIEQQQQQHHHHPSQAPLSLSLCRPEDVLHQQQQHLGGSSRQHQAPAAWMQMHDTAPHGQGAAWHLRSSRFLLPAQQLLQRFCNLPVADSSKRPAKAPSTQQQEDGVGDGSSTSSSAWTPSAQIQAMDALELQRLKDRLYVMLEEVDRRYRRYCEQMRAVAGGFEAVAGDRAAAAYTALAARTISRHFRNLRDGIVGQLLAVRKGLGEKDVSAALPGMTRGQTPRLKVLDQCIRQHKALHQSGMMESHPWRPQRGLPERAVTILRAWLFEHFLHPYPSDVDKHILARQTGLSRSQVSNWFINARVRLWKPMVEEMYVEEMKLDGQQLQDGNGGGLQPGLNPNPSSSSSHASDAQRHVGGEEGDHREGAEGADRKPTPGQLHHMIHDAGSLASVVHTTGAAVARMENFGIMDHLDFDAYDDGGQGGFVGAGGGVSLTLGLQQHDSHGGVNIAFGAPPSAQGGGAGGFVFPGEAQIQFGTAMVDGAEASAHGQEHYRGLSAGFHLLRDLAG